MGVVLAIAAIFVVLFVVLPLAGLALWALVSTVVVGLVIGALGRLIIPGRQPIGLVATLLVGLVGSIVGGYIGQHVLHIAHVLTVLLEIGVAAVLVAGYSAARRRSSLGGPPGRQLPPAY